MPTHDLNFELQRLGECRIATPKYGVQFVDEDDHVLLGIANFCITGCLVEEN